MIEIKNRTGEVIFTSETAKSIKDAVEYAVKWGTNLRVADLRGADLEGTNLEGANLRGANLRGTNLRVADLRGADLEGTNLEGANLRGADLWGADLSGANLSNSDLSNSNLSNSDLRGADLNGTAIPLYSKWGVYIKDDKIKIGCKTKSIEGWDAWFASDKEYETPRNTEEFKRIHAHYQASRAYVLAMQ